MLSYDTNYFEPPHISLPYMYIGSNRSSRKYKQIQMNNNVVLSSGDVEGAGYVSLYGQLFEIEDLQQTKSMFPKLWYLFLNGPDDPRFVMFKLQINTIEFLSHRYNFDSSRNDWKPFILKRDTKTLQSEVAEWQIYDSPDILIASKTKTQDKKDNP